MLEIRNLTKTYRGGKVAVSDLSLNIEAGDIFGFIGHNGAGKTTTIKCVTGIIGFDSGEILVDGHSVRREPIACKQRIAYIPDNPDLYEHLTGAQYVKFICDVFQVSDSDRRARVERYAEALGMQDSLGELISAYSHGMKQRLALIAALAHAPKLMVLDEPFVGLDPAAALTLKEIMREKCAEGAAVFFSTHVLDVAEKLCNKVAIIREGALVAAGRTDELTGGRSLEDVFMEVVGRA